MKNLLASKILITHHALTSFLPIAQRVSKNVLTLETGMQDFHKLIITLLKVKPDKLPPRIIKYRDDKNCDSKAFKACVRYFLTNYHFSPNDSPSKTMKHVFISSKKLFSSSRYSNFCIFIFPSFSPCQPLLQSLIQDKSSSLHVINCLNMNLKNILFDILRMKKGMTLKLYPLIEY